MEQLVPILRTLSKNWLKLFLLPMAIMGILFFLTKNQESKYKTEAKLYLNLQENESISLTENSMKQYQVHAYFQNLIELLKSKNNIEAVQLLVVKQAVTDSMDFFLEYERLKSNHEAIINRIDELLENRKHLNGYAQTDLMIRDFLNQNGLTSENMRDMIIAYRLTDSNFMKFELTDKDPRSTKLLADLFIQVLVSENKRISKNQIKSHREMVEQLVAQAKKELDTKIKKLDEFKVKNNIINLGEHTKAIVVYQVQLEGQRANLLSKIAAGQKGKSEIIATAELGNELTMDLSSHEEILSLKSEIKALNKQQLLASLNNKDLSDISEIEERIKSTREAIHNKVTQISNKKTYDPSQFQMELASKYLWYDLEEETSKDMLKILDGELRRVGTYSQKFAPYESTISSMESEISIAQNAYLLLLNKLNLTQSLEYGSGEHIIEIVDSPKLPTKPEPSKRIIVVAGSGIAVFTVLSAILILFQLINASITNVQKFERDSKFKVSAALPSFERIKDPILKNSTRLIRHQQLLLIVKRMERLQKEGNNIFTICSNQLSEGRHFLGIELKNILTEANQSVALLNADWSKKEVEGYEDIIEMVDEGKIFTNRKEINQHVRELSRQNDWVFVVIPPVNICTDYHYWFEMTSNILYAFRAGRVRNHADVRFEEYLENLSLSYLGVVLNGIEIDEMEDYVGEIPKKRNKVRKMIRKLVYRDFANAYN